MRERIEALADVSIDPEQLANEIWAEVTEAVKTHLAFMATVDPELAKPLKPFEQDWIDVGVMAGYQCTLEVLMRRKMIKGA